MNCDFKNDLIQITNGKRIAKKLLFLTHFQKLLFQNVNFEVNQAESFLIIDENDSKYMTNRKSVEGDVLEELDKLRLKIQGTGTER